MSTKNRTERINVRASLQTDNTMKSIAKELGYSHADIIQIALELLDFKLKKSRKNSELSIVLP